MPTNVFSIESNSVDPQIIIALLSELGFHGFEEESTQVLAYTQENNLEQPVLDLAARIGFTLIDVVEIEDKNWNEVWESSFDPILFHDKVYVRAAFHPALNRDDVLEIVITPEMAFGTGHHPTTAMMIETILKLDLAGKDLFDFGAGTAILAILAKKCGAHTVAGVEIEHRAVESAQANILLNHCPDISIAQGDSMPTIAPTDVILANVNRRVILETLSAFSLGLKPTGILVVSGILDLDQDLVVQTALENELQLIDKLQQGDWLCLTFQRT